MPPDLDWHAAVAAAQAWAAWRRYEANQRALADRIIAQLDEQFPPTKEDAHARPR